MKPSILGPACCTTPSAMCFWAAAFLVVYGTGRLIGAAWPPLAHYEDTLLLVALSTACFINFGRNRTLHCGLTGPLFMAGAIVTVLAEAGLWNVNLAALWGLMLVGLGLAFFVEWRVVGGRKRESKA